MRKGFNKYGNLEIEDSLMKYRISIEQLGVEDPLALEKEIKRKIQTISEDYRFVLPSDIQVISRYMILYYELSYLKPFDYLQALDLEDKLPFFLSLVELAKKETDDFHILWDKNNIVLDIHEQAVKAILFETDSLKIYEPTTDILKTVRDMMVTSMTTLTRVIHLPKRPDFIDPSEENIQFVENLYKITSLDDMAMYIETLSLDIEQAASIDEVDIKASAKKIPFLKKSEKKNTTESKEKKPNKVQAKPKKKASGNKKKNPKKMNIPLIAGMVVLVILAFVSPMLAPSSETNGDADLPVESTGEESGYFKGSAQPSEDLVQAYRKAYNSEYKDAHAYLAKLDKSKLDAKDIPLLIQVYEESGNLPSLIDEVPVLANDIVTYLLTRNKLNKLPEISDAMETKNPYIEFEKAHLTQDYTLMLSLVDSIEINGRKESQIVDAYLYLEQLDEARQFAEKVGNPDLIKRVEEYRN